MVTVEKQKFGESFVKFEDRAYSIDDYDSINQNNMNNFYLNNIPITENNLNINSISDNQNLNQNIQNANQSNQNNENNQNNQGNQFNNKDNLNINNNNENQNLKISEEKNENDILNQNLEVDNINKVEVDKVLLDVNSQPNSNDIKNGKEEIKSDYIIKENNDNNINNEKILINNQEPSENFINIREKIEIAIDNETIQVPVENIYNFETDKNNFINSKLTNQQLSEHLEIEKDLKVENSLKMEEKPNVDERLNNTTPLEENSNSIKKQISSNYHFPVCQIPLKYRPEYLKKAIKNLTINSNN